MSDQDKIYTALRESRLYDLPRELLVMLIENITKLNRDAFMQELVPVQEGYVRRADLESESNLTDKYACGCHTLITIDRWERGLRCGNCKTMLCPECMLPCALCPRDDKYCSNCTEVYDYFGWMCRDHAVENVRRE